MSQQPDTLHYAAKDPAVYAPWNRGVRFRYLPAVVISILALLVLEFALPSLRRIAFPQPLGALMARVQPGILFPMVACFGAVMAKRRGTLRLWFSLLALVVAAVASLFAPRPSPGDFPAPNCWQSTAWACAFFALASIWAVKTPADLAILFPKALLAAASVWAGFTVLLDADRLLAGGRWAWNVPWFGNPVRIDELLIGCAFTVASWLLIAWISKRWLAGPRGGAAMAFLALGVLSTCTYFGLSEARERLVAEWLVREKAAFPDHYATDAWRYFLDHHPSRGAVRFLIGRYAWGTWSSMTLWAHGPPDPALELLPDDDANAESFAELLRRRPAAGLAELLAERIAAHKRYEAAPVLLYYALFMHDDICREALRRMSVKQAAWAYLYVQYGTLNTLDGPIPITPLNAFFPQEKNLSAAEWLAFVRINGVGYQESVPPEASDACDRVIAQYRRYSDACDRLMDYYREHPGTRSNSGLLLGSEEDNTLAGTVQQDLTRAAGISMERWRGVGIEEEPAVVDDFVGQVDAFLAAHAGGPPAPAVPQAPAAAPQ